MKKKKKNPIEKNEMKKMKNEMRHPKRMWSGWWLTR
jgi:hypothetical protein